MEDIEALTVCGKNLTEIAKLCNIEKKDLTSKYVKQNMRYCEIPENEKWRETMLTEMMVYRNCDFVREDHILKNEINQIIDMVCTT